MSLSEIVKKAAGTRGQRLLAAAAEQAEAALEAGGRETVRRHWEREMAKIQAGRETEMEREAKKEEQHGDGEA